MQLFAHMEHPCSTPGLARGHREAAATAEYFLSAQNKLVHEAAALAQQHTLCNVGRLRPWAQTGHTVTHTGDIRAGGTGEGGYTQSDPGQGDPSAQPMAHLNPDVSPSLPWAWIVLLLCFFFFYSVARYLEVQVNIFFE